jgi:hypothetical protein
VKQGADGALIVDDDFELIAFDFVSNPSTHGAFMEQKAVNEGKELVTESASEAQKERSVWAPVEQRVSEIIQEMNCDFRGECNLK